MGTIALGNGGSGFLLLLLVRAALTLTHAAHALLAKLVARNRPVVVRMRRHCNADNNVGGPFSGVGDRYLGSFHDQVVKKLTNMLLRLRVGRSPVGRRRENAPPRLLAAERAYSPERHPHDHELRELVVVG